MSRTTTVISFLAIAAGALLYSEFSRPSHDPTLAAIATGLIILGGIALVGSLLGFRSAEPLAVVIEDHPDLTTFNPPTPFRRQAKASSALLPVALDGCAGRRTRQ